MPKHNITFERVLNAVVATAALSVAFAVLHREFVREESRDAISVPEAALTEMQGWEALSTHGIALGPDDAPIRIFVFADIECPFCKQFHETVQNIERTLPGQIELVFLHFPIEGHRFARLGAKAIECADAVDRPREMIDRLYERQDSLGLKSWTELALEAGIADTAAFQSCFTDPVPVARIDSARAVGVSLKVNGTPTVIVNGWRFSSPPSEQELRELIQKILASGSSERR